MKINHHSSFSEQAHVRHLGKLEHLFYATNHLLGDCQLVGMYQLSKSISLSQLQFCAEQLRSRYRMLQMSVEANWKTGTAYFVQADHLKTCVKQHTDQINAQEFMHKLLTEREEIIKTNLREGRSMIDQEPSEYLPWSLNLSNSGDHVIISVPHLFMDGMSIDIIGAEIIRMLNGQEVTDAKSIVEIPKPLEEQFGKISRTLTVKSYIDSVLRILKIIDPMGMKTKNVPRDWTHRETILQNVTIGMHEIQSFHQSCKRIGVSLNSGMVSAFYEAMSRTSPFNTKGKRVPIMMALDSRSRVEKGSDLNSGSIGLFAASLETSETGDEGKWQERAESLQGKVHSKTVLKEFPASCQPLGLLARNSTKTMPSMANSKGFGRIQFLCFSNLGRTSRINAANEHCLTESDGADITQIQNVFFDESGCATGFYLSVHLSTVGDNLSFCITGYEPFISRQSLANLCEEFSQSLRSSITL